MKAWRLQLWSLLILVISISFLQGCGALESEESYDIVSNLILEWRETNLHVSWTFLNPSGHLGHYSVTWNDDVHTVRKVQNVSVKELTIGSTFPCLHVLNITVSPHNKTDWKMGKAASRSDILQDIPTDISFEEKGSITRVKWLLKCRTKSYLTFNLTCHRVDGKSSVKEYTSNISARRGRTQFSGQCPNESDLCSSYFIFIRPMIGVPSIQGIPATDCIRNRSRSSICSSSSISGRTSSTSSSTDSRTAIPTSTSSSTTSTTITSISTIVPASISSTNKQTTTKSSNDSKTTPVTPPMMHSPEWLLWAFAAAIGCCVVAIFVLVFIVVRRKYDQEETRRKRNSYRASQNCFRSQFGNICCNFRNDTASDQDDVGDFTPPIYGRISAEPNQNAFEMRVFDGTRTSRAGSLTGYTYGRYNAPSRVVNQTLTLATDLANIHQASGEEKSLINRTGLGDGNRTGLGTETFVGGSSASNAENFSTTQKHKLLEALSLLASIRGNENISSFLDNSATAQSLRVQSELLHYKVYSEEHEERLSEAMRLINEFIAAGGNSSELVDIAGRPSSIAETLGDHTYYYPRLTKKVIEAILADTKKRQQNKRVRR